MPATPLALTDALKALGKAVPLVAANPTTIGGWVALGATEGAVTVSGLGAAEINVLAAKEHTGGLAHQATAMPGTPMVNIPVIAGVPALWSIINPYGSADGFPDNPPPVAEKSLWLVPLSAWSGISTIGYNGSAWDPVDSPTRVENAILFMRGFFTSDDVPFQQEDGGKAIVTVHFTPMYYGAAPAGKRAFIRGDPVAKGFTTFRA